MNINSESDSKQAMKESLAPYQPEAQVSREPPSPPSSRCARASSSTTSFNPALQAIPG